MADKKFIRECMMMLDVAGCNPFHQNAWTKVRATITITCMAILFFELGLQFGLNWKGFEDNQPLMLSSAYSQVIYKLLGLVKNRRQVREFVKHVEQFWAWDGLDPSLKDELEKLSAFGWRALKVLFFSCGGCVIIELFTPLFFGKHALPLDTYHPLDRDNNLVFCLAYTVQVSVAVVLYFGIMAFDNFFLTCSLYAVFELKIIKHRFRSIAVNPDVAGDDERCLQEMGVLVDHHNLVLGCIKVIDDIFSGPILLQLSNSVLLICSSLLGLISEGMPPDLSHIYYFTPILGVAVLQVLIYCSGGEFVLTESDGIADAIYSSDWWVKTQPKFRRYCMLVIQRSHKPELLTGGGMFILNMETFSKILKFSLSFLSLAQAMRKEENN